LSHQLVKPRRYAPSAKKMILASEPSEGFERLGLRIADPLNAPARGAPTHRDDRGPFSVRHFIYGAVARAGSLAGFTGQRADLHVK
jgi:hypothetical protein